VAGVLALKTLSPLLEGRRIGEMNKMRLILASASPRRAELLTEAGMGFEVVVSAAEEPEEKPAGLPVEVWPMCLAFMKATAVRGQIKERRGMKDAVILGADTIVVEGGRILNKARDRGHARRMLSSLRGKTHRVVTGIALVQGEGKGREERVRLSSAEALCRVKRVSDAWLERYLDSGLWKGKAGAYGIQDPLVDPFVELVEGEFGTVVGLPVKLVQSELASFVKG
jgi:septum formation protein